MCYALIYFRIFFYFYFKKNSSEIKLILSFLMARGFEANNEAYVNKSESNKENIYVPLKPRGQKKPKKISE